MAEEILNQGQQENAENLNENVSGQAKEIISAALEETQNRETSPVLKADSNVTDKFKGLPMRELIAAPLIAAAEAQQELAATAWNFYQQIAFDGKSGNKARILEFDVERPIQQNEKMTTIKQTVKAPFIGLVPIPALLIDRVDVDFQMEVTDTSNVKSTTNAEVEAKASAKRWFINAENLNENVSGQAKEIISAALEETKNNGTSPVLGDPNVTDNFKGLPMRELIAAPLIAAAEAQQELAATAWNFYQKIAFDEDGKTARVLEFDIKRPIQQDGKMTTMSQSVKAPFIGLVPIPSLLIDRVDVDFQMEVTDTSNVKSTTNAEVETKASAKHWFINAEISGKVTTARENTRMTNQTAKYQIHVSASQQPQTEGLSKLMDIMASCIEPINTESSK